MIKKLLTLLFVGLSVISFSFASYESQCEGISPSQRFEIGLEEEIYNSNNNYFELKPEANLLYNGSQKVFHYGDNDNGMWFFWNNQKLYYIKTRNGGISDQGYFGYYVLTNYGNTCAGNSNNIDNFYSNSDFANPDGFNYFAGSYYLTPCFEYSDLNINVCFNHNSLTGSLGITTGDLNNLSSLYQNSYFGPGIVVPNDNIEENSCFINQHAIVGLESLGLSQGYCYGGFPIDDIFEPGQTIDDFTGYTFGAGASIRDLYNLYSGSFASPGQFMGSMLQAYDNGQINRFKTEPKALIMFVQQYSTARKNGALFNFSDIREYCKLYTGMMNDNNNNWSNQCYTGGSLNQSRIGYNQFKVDQDYKFNISGGAIGVFGNKTGFDNPKQFFGRLTNLFNNGLYYQFTERQGVLPTYLVYFLFAIILIRIISRSNG